MDTFGVQLSDVRERPGWELSTNSKPGRSHNHEPAGKVQSQDLGEAFPDEI